ESSFHSWG
nr:leucokinin VI [Rhyparobia maderae]